MRLLLLITTFITAVFAEPGPCARSAFPGGFPALPVAFVADDPNGYVRYDSQHKPQNLTSSFGHVQHVRSNPFGFPTKVQQLGSGASRFEDPKPVLGNPFGYNQIVFRVADRRSERQTRFEPVAYIPSNPFGFAQNIGPRTSSVQSSFESINTIPNTPFGFSEKYVDLNIFPQERTSLFEDVPSFPKILYGFPRNIGPRTSTSQSSFEPIKTIPIIPFGITKKSVDHNILLKERPSLFEDVSSFPKIPFGVSEYTRYLSLDLPRIFENTLSVPEYPYGLSSQVQSRTVSPQKRPSLFESIDQISGNPYGFPENVQQFSSELPNLFRNVDYVRKNPYGVSLRVQENSDSLLQRPSFAAIDHIDKNSYDVKSLNYKRDSLPSAFEYVGQLPNTPYGFSFGVQKETIALRQRSSNFEDVSYISKNPYGFSEKIRQLPLDIRSSFADVEYISGNPFSFSNKVEKSSFYPTARSSLFEKADYILRKPYGFIKNATSQSTVHNMFEDVKHIPNIPFGYITHFNSSVDLPLARPSLFEDTTAIHKNPYGYSEKIQLLSSDLPSVLGSSNYISENPYSYNEKINSLYEPLRKIESGFDVGSSSILRIPFGFEENVKMSSKPTLRFENVGIVHNIPFDFNAKADDLLPRKERPSLFRNAEKVKKNPYGYSEEIKLLSDPSRMFGSKDYILNNPFVFSQEVTNLEGFRKAKPTLFESVSSIPKILYGVSNNIEYRKDHKSSFEEVTSVFKYPFGFSSEIKSTSETPYIRSSGFGEVSVVPLINNGFVERAEKVSSDLSSIIGTGSAVLYDPLGISPVTERRPETLQEMPHLFRKFNVHVNNPYGFPETVKSVPSKSRSSFGNDKSVADNPFGFNYNIKSDPANLRKILSLFEDDVSAPKINHGATENIDRLPSALPSIFKNVEVVSENPFSFSIKANKTKDTLKTTPELFDSVPQIPAIPYRFSEKVAPDAEIQGRFEKVEAVLNNPFGFPQNGEIKTLSS
ncbi:hypothetical protein SK128_018776 [Halocaridina rubra]|uniref:Uncharacterized protein n=1 Tax=Halocaridina rubra TaxID=373956 RepID=A0AAN9AAM1_HALRR